MKNDVASNFRANITRLVVDERDLQKDRTAFEAHLRTHSLELARELNIGPVDFHKTDVDASVIRTKATELSALLHINPQPVLDFDLFPGFQLLPPPYDTSWNVGSGLAYSAWDGAPGIFWGDGFSASGFGIHVNSDRHVAVSIVPQGQFTAGWVNFNSPAPLGSSGGTGTVVYCDGSLLLSRQPKVWDVKNPSAYSSAQFDLPLAATATPPLPGSLGTVPLAPVLFDMLPGKRYLIWFYLWQLNHSISGKGFMVFSQAKIPFIAVRVADPLFLH